MVVSCAAPVALPAGFPRTVAELTRGRVMVVPMFAALLGSAFFFPHFTRAWARNLPGRSGQRE